MGYQPHRFPAKNRDAARCRKRVIPMPENIVLYKRTGLSEKGKPVRHPLFSTDTDDSNAPAKILAKMSLAYSDADKSGAPMPELEVILQATETDKETGKQVSDTEYTLLNPSTLAPLGKPQRSLESIV